MNGGYRFTRSAAGRIARAVRKIEQADQPDALPGYSDTGLLGIQFRRFELLTALTPGGTATAGLLRRIGNEIRLTHARFTVADFTGRFRGRARGSKPPPNDRGSRGLAIKLPDERDWQILFIESDPAQQARWIRFVLAEDLLWGQSSALAEVADSWQGDPPDGPVVVRNCPRHVSGYYVFAGPAGSNGLACYVPDADHYYIVQMECPD